MQQKSEETQYPPLKKSLYLKGITEYNKLEKKIKHKGSNVKKFREKIGMDDPIKEL